MITQTKIEGKFHPMNGDITRTLRFANLTVAVLTMGFEEVAE